MSIETKNTISKVITNALSLFKFVLAIFLIIVIFAWIVQFFELERYIPFIDDLNKILNNLSAIFYTPTKNDEESYNALLYMSIGIVFFLLIFDTMTDIIGDIFKLNARHEEEVLAEENARINEQIQQNYKKHLTTAFNFTVILKLEINNTLNKTQAFQDANLEEKIKQEEQKILKDIFSILTMSIKCPSKTKADMLVLDINNAENLNKILNFIVNVCTVEKYQKCGLEYFIAVSTHAPDESTNAAIQEALRLIKLRNKQKIICHEIVCECLKQLKRCNFNFENNGSYSTDENDVLFELVNKN